MKSISSITFVAAAVLLGASKVSAVGAVVYQACYSSSTGLSFNSSYTFNSKGYCQTQCAPLNDITFATSNSTDCWCGSELPPTSSKVDDSFCNEPCSGYDLENCGAMNYWSVYLTGLTTSAPVAGSSGTSSSATNPSATTSAKPSVVTVGGQTVFVTPTGSAGASTSGSSSSGGGTSKAGIAAGVVVGIVAIAAIGTGVFLFLRHRRRREVEEEYRRNAAVSSFIGGGKPPTSSGGGSSFTDMRLDPAVMAQRRMSDGSIADNQDYSRRILKVTNA